MNSSGFFHLLWKSIEQEHTEKLAIHMSFRYVFWTHFFSPLKRMRKLNNKFVLHNTHNVFISVFLLRTVSHSDYRTVTFTYFWNSIFSSVFHKRISKWVLKVQPNYRQLFPLGNSFLKDLFKRKKVFISVKMSCNMLNGVPL